MSEPTDFHGDADAAWFRAQIDPIVDADPVPDAWPAIAARTGEPAIDPAGRRPSRRTRWLAAAAAVLLVAAGATAVAASRHDGEDTSTVTTAPPEPTGWYVPEGLPYGWKLESATASPGRKSCERHGAQWSDPANHRSMSLAFDACGRAMTADDRPDVHQSGMPPEIARGPSLQEIELGNGVTATGMRLSNEDPDVVDVRGFSWNDGDGAWSIGAVGLSYDQQVAAAKRFVADPDRTDPGIAGMRKVDEWTAPARARSASVEVMMANPDGLRATFTLALPGDGQRPGDSSVLVPVDVTGQANPVLRFDTQGFWAVRYGGTWPGADLTVMRLTTGPTDPEHMITDAGLEHLIGSLRPATSQEWQAFLAEATRGVSPSLLEASTLADLASQDVPPSSSPEGYLVMPTTTTTAAPTTTDPDAPSGTATTPTPGSGPVTSAAGTGLPNDVHERDAFTEFDGLDVRLQLESGTIRAGSPVAGTLLLTNPTDHDVDLTECSDMLTRWGLVPADDPGQELPHRVVRDCSATTTVSIPAGQTVRYRQASFDPDQDRWPFAAQRRDPRDANGSGVLGTLDGGRYLAIMEVPGRRFDLRLTVPVTVPEPACPTSDDVVERYVNLTEAKAQAQAERDGWDFRIVSGPGSAGAIEQDLTCGRINVDLNQDGLVTNALRY